MSPFSAELFNSPELIQEVLAAGNTGLWVILLNPENGEGQMMANATMLTLLGLDVHPSPQDCYKHWFSRIDKNAEPLVVEVVEKMIRTGTQQEVQYSWLHPARGSIFVRCGGKVQKYKENGGSESASQRAAQQAAQTGLIRIMGYHQDISELESMRRLLQDSLTRLENVSKFSDALIRLNEEYRTMAYMDVLTGLSNRRAFFEQGEKLLASVLSSGSTWQACLVMADIDHFKVINDTYTHPRGDEVLKEMARRLHGPLRKNELCGRIGGEEFAILLPDVGLLQAARVADRIRRFCGATPVNTKTGAIPVTASFGVAAVRQGLPAAIALQDALQRADGALYHAKQAGRNRVSLYPDDGDEPVPAPYFSD